MDPSVPGFRHPFYPETGSWVHLSPIASCTQKLMLSNPPAPNTTGSPAAHLDPPLPPAANSFSGLTQTVCPVPISQATLPVCWLVQLGTPCDHILTCKRSPPSLLAPQVHGPLWPVVCLHLSCRHTCALNRAPGKELQKDINGQTGQTAVIQGRAQLDTYWPVHRWPVPLVTIALCFPMLVSPQATLIPPFPHLWFPP